MMRSTVFAALLLVLASFQTVNYKLTTQEFEDKLKTTADGQIVDVRTPEEFKKNHLKGAMNLNINGEEFQRQVAALDKNKTVLVYCWSGGRSSRAAEYMRQQGLTVFEMKDGMMRWLQENRSVEASVAPSAGMSMEEYSKLIVKDKLVLVDFNAVWCAPCKKMSPYLDEFSKTYAKQLNVVKIDSEKHATVVKGNAVAAVPTLILYKNGQEIWRNEGFIEKEKVEEVLKKNF